MKEATTKWFVLISYPLIMLLFLVLTAMQGQFYLFCAFLFLLAIDLIKIINRLLFAYETKQALKRRIREDR